tara:strand:- start:15 stop:260 length:246 start_codon:yes stop_codon:yes gene_type:complete
VTQSVNILRIVFNSGRVVEERGGEDMIIALFARDIEGLIDYIMAIDMSDGKVNIYCDEDDQRFNNTEVLMSTDVLRWNRRS